MDMLPDVVESQYKLAMKNGNTAAAKFFADLISKNEVLDAPVQKVQPFVLVGVPQDKIDQLFVPRGYEKADKLIPEGEVEE